MTAPSANRPAKYDGRATPALERLTRVANALGTNLRERVVFIGGSLLPILETDRNVFASVRPTKDVDAVVITTTYTQKGMIEDELRRLGFRHDTSGQAHADRWKSPDDLIFDLVSCGNHMGGTGNAHDAFAIETSELLDLPPIVRHASAVGFLTLKCGAYRDRGTNLPLASKDLMDLVGLIATKPSLPAEVEQAPESIREFIRGQVRGILESPDAVSAIPSHIRDREPLADDVEQNVMTRLREIAGA